QAWWARDKSPITRRERIRTRWRPERERETRYWVEVMETARQQLKAHGRAQPWFQMDRGADAWPVLRAAAEHEDLITVRATHDRRVELESSRCAHLNAVMAAQPELGRYRLHIPKRPGREGRDADIALRVKHVVLSVRVSDDKRVAVAMNAVLATETNRR